jgi:hypothetical protein
LPGQQGSYSVETSLLGVREIILATAPFLLHALHQGPKWVMCTVVVIIDHCPTQSMRLCSCPKTEVQSTVHTHSVTHQQIHCQPQHTLPQRLPADYSQLILMRQLKNSQWSLPSSVKVTLYTVTRPYAGFRHPDRISAGLIGLGRGKLLL